ncbi:MAG: hypothetical protein WA726_02535 [Acidimicrobiia bacterium]
MSGRDDERRIRTDGSYHSDAPEPTGGTERVSKRTAALIAALTLAVGLLAGSIISGGRDNTPVDVSGSTVLSAVATSTTAVLTTTTQSPPPTSQRFPPTSLEVLRGAEELRGLVVAAPHPGSSGGAPLWVLGGEGLVRRYEVPLWPGDYPHPLILSSGQVAFADLDKVYLVDVDLSSPPEAVSEGSYLLPSGTPDLVWIIGDGATWIAPLDTSTGVVGEQTDVAGVVSWAEAGLESGVLVLPVDEVNFGRVAYWAPGADLQPVELAGPDPHLIASSGALAAFLSSDNTVEIHDVANSATVGRFSLDLDGSIGVSGCLSPDGSSIALYGEEVRDVVVSSTTGEVLHELEDVEHEKLNWITTDQLVVQTVADEGRILQMIDLTAGITIDIASLSGLGSWWMTASGSNC